MQKRDENEIRNLNLGNGEYHASAMSSIRGTVGSIRERALLRRLCTCARCR